MRTVALFQLLSCLFSPGAASAKSIPITLTPRVALSSCPVPVLVRSRVSADAFSDLADLIEEFPTLAERSRFLVMPGPGDVGPSAALPRPSLPKSLAGGLLEVPTVQLVSNPCRLRWHAQELVLFRDDLGGRMRRGCVRPPHDEFVAGEARERSCPRARTGIPARPPRSLPNILLLWLWRRRKADEGSRDGSCCCGVQEAAEEAAPESNGQKTFKHLAATLMQQARALSSTTPRFSPALALSSSAFSS